MPIHFENSRLVEKERYFREFTVWPLISEFDSENWLSNFPLEERKVAERLLINFTYFNEQMTDALLRTAVQSYFSVAIKNETADIRKMDDYIRETAFVICEGESPRPTDSGHLFARKLRDRFNIPEDQIFWPRSALEQRSRFSRFVFIDDFTGSGNQFLKTWRTKHNVSDTQMSYGDFSKQSKLAFAYCCCIATTKARKEIKREAPSVALCPAHLLTEESNAVSLSSRTWEDSDALAAIQVIKAASSRAGYEAENCGQDDWRGYHCLGLTLAFNHGIPDASLPIFFSQRNDWRPLIVRPDHD